VGTGGTVLITVGQAFLLIPLSLAHLGTPLYGAWLAASELLIWVQLLDFGIPNLLTQRIGAALGRSDQDNAGRWVSTGLIMLSVIAVTLVAAAMAAASLVTDWAGVSAADAAAFNGSFRLGGVASGLLLISNGAAGISRGVQRTATISAAQVSGALAGLCASAALLIADYGIWALGLGLLVRSVVAVLGGIAFFVDVRRHTRVRIVSPSSALFRESGALMPSMFAGSAGYVLANSTEIVLVTTLYGPVAAAVYGLTRRALDGVRNLLDSIAWASYGPFAHLVTAEDRHRAGDVLNELLWGRFAVACVAAAVVVSVNAPFVALLFGAENFGGLLLTAMFAAQMVVGGQAFLANYLLRAAGSIEEGSFLLAGEALLRVVMMSGGLWAAGLVGAPAAAVVSSAAGLVLMHSRLRRELRLKRSSVVSRVRGYLPLAAIFFGGLAVSGLGLATSWPSLVITALAVGAGGTAMVWRMMPPEISGGSLFRWRT
jgi:O-antigen/teichoic acid export membrane protein